MQTQQEKKQHSKQIIFLFFLSQSITLFGSTQAYWGNGILQWRCSKKQWKKADSFLPGADNLSSRNEAALPAVW